MIQGSSALHCRIRNLIHLLKGVSVVVAEVEGEALAYGFLRFVRFVPPFVA